MIDDRFIIQLQGKNFVTYEGLLDQAHQQGLESIVVEIIQLPEEDNNMTAVCRATAKSGDKVFTDFGDASPVSVGKNIIPHILRMASTRAKARALRDLTNIGITAVEELDIAEKEETANISAQKNAERKKHVSYTAKTAPTKKQLETIKDLSISLNIPVDVKKLDKESAGTLIAQLLDEKYKRH